MGKGLCGLMVGVFAGVFVGSLALELVRKTDLAKKVGEGLESAKKAFNEGYQGTEEQEAREA